MIDIECLKANYDKDEWEKITEGWTKCNVVPGAILAINALIKEVERLHIIEQAAINMCMVKGRHHSELAMNRLMEVCGKK